MEHHLLNAAVGEHALRADPRDAAINLDVVQQRLRTGLGVLQLQQSSSAFVTLATIDIRTC